MKVAIIDIGSNSLRLLLGQKINDVWQNEPKMLWSTRLGNRNLDGTLTEEGMRKSLEALREIRIKIEKYRATKVIGLATSAVREASNGQEFLAKAKIECPMDAYILSGDEEASYGFSGALVDLLPDGKHYTTIDVGGGSTELALGSKEGIYWTRSYPVGAVQMKEISDEGPQRIWQETTGLWDPMPIAGTFGEFVGLGGTITTLAAIALELEEYDAKKVQGYYLSREIIEGLIMRIRYASPKERENIIGLPANRQDIIVAGAEIVTAFMDAYEVPYIVVSDKDAMEGYEITLT